MTTVCISNILSFTGAGDVLIKSEAVNHDAEEVMKAIKLAFHHMGNPHFIEGHCGGTGVFARRGIISLDAFLEIAAEAERIEATKKAKKELTKIRRKEFGTARAALALSMIENGHQYVCKHDECNISIDLTIDHIVPLSRGGSDDIGNLQFLCKKHNSTKGDRV